jgi:hypothetical protein
VFRNGGLSRRRLFGSEELGDWSSSGCLLFGRRGGLGFDRPGLRTMA